MLVQKAVDIINVLQDKYGSPNLIDAETVDHINMAIGEYLNRVFPDNQGGVVNFEFDSNVTSNLQPLIYSLSSLNMSGTGYLTNTVINAALTAAVGSTATYLKVGGLRVTSGIPIKYVKQNNIAVYQNNSFKTPTSAHPYFTFEATGIKIYPTDVALSLTLNVIKSPKVLTVSDLGNAFEFSDYVAYNVIAIALKYAGISTRDESLLEDIRMTAIHSTQ